MRTTTLSALTLAVATWAGAASGQQAAPSAPKTFIDYFLPMPMPASGALSKDVWGAPEVGPRDPQNGLEDSTVKQWYYWDGQLIRSPDGKYHLYASRWDQAKGHRGWVDSKAVHAVSDTLAGPYVDKGLCWPDNQGGKGHNVTALTLPDGRYAIVISETRPGTVFVSKSPDGPWEQLGLIQIATNAFTHLGRMSNVSIMVRPDGDFEIVPRSGAILISKSGILGPYVVQGPSIYPGIAGLPQTDLRNFEDPVVWFSGGYYHIVVNNWSQRKAYHLTSRNGIDGWVFRGLAYDPTRDFLRYADGTVNRWHKLERPGVLLENGHVVAVTLAVLDVPKEQQKGNDAHGSKVIVVPFDGAALDRDLQQADAEGPFTADMESLKQVQCPEWFRDAKFGIWAHWGPQSVPMFGDWYAKRMYQEGDAKYRHHLEHYGHPSTNGWKDIIPLWKAEKFDPDRLMALYKAAGARYFVSMACHHDNFDLWASKHHRWNAAEMGPRRDIVAAWQKAAKKQGLRFGVSEHMGASFTWWQVSHGADKQGPLAGAPYDGADPRWQDLYHWPAAPGDTAWYSVDPRWHQVWLARVTDLIDQIKPDLLYSDGALPFGKTGCAMLAHFYNANIARNGGRLEAVYCLKDWTSKPGHGDYVEGIGVQDVERGGLSGIKDAPWQTDTSIGDWFYNSAWKAKDTGTMYRSPKWVIQTLADVVSKNGNLLLNVIQRPDGSLDPEVETLLKDLAEWMAVNGEAIFDTRPWRVFGEGPSSVSGGHFKEDFGFTAADVRFTRSKDGRAVYAIALGVPDQDVTITSLAKTDKPIKSVRLLGSKATLDWKQGTDGLAIKPPAAWPCRHAVAFKVDLAP